MVVKFVYNTHLRVAVEVVEEVVLVHTMVEALVVVLIVVEDLEVLVVVAAVPEVAQDLDLMIVEEAVELEAAVVVVVLAAVVLVVEVLALLEVADTKRKKKRWRTQCRKEGGTFMDTLAVTLGNEMGFFFVLKHVPVIIKKNYFFYFTLLFEWYSVYELLFIVNSALTHSLRSAVLCVACTSNMYTYYVLLFQLLYYYT